MVHVRFSILEWALHETIATEIRKHSTLAMGCGPSSPAVSESTVPDSKKRRQSVVLPPPDIPINLGSNVKFQPPPNSKIIVIIGKCISQDSLLAGLCPRLACLASY